jgi:hypothetical protein
MHTRGDNDNHGLGAALTVGSEIRFGILRIELEEMEVSVFNFVRTQSGMGLFRVRLEFKLRTIYLNQRLL